MSLASPLSSPVDAETTAVHDYEAAPPIGIDLGTSNSAIARWIRTSRRLGPEVYTLNQYGAEKNSQVMSSLLYLGEDDEGLLVGRIAYARRLLKPERIAAAVKTRIGESKPVFALGAELFTPVALSARLVAALFEETRRQGLRKPPGFVVSVPYYFKQHQNHNTRLAAEAGIEEAFKHLPPSDRPRFLGLIPEPVAAVLDYVFRNLDRPLNEIALVVDMGGGTLDLTLLRLRLTPAEIDMEVLSCEGDADFGGIHFDRLIADWIREQWPIDDSELDLREKRRVAQTVQNAAVQAKEDLSEHKAAEILLTGLPAGESFEARLRRADFERMLLGANSARRNYGAELSSLLERALKKARLEPENVAKVLLIGGSTRIPLFRQMVGRQLPGSAVLEDWDSVYTSVARGTAIYAAYLLDREQGTSHLPQDRRIRFLARSSHGLGVETNRGRAKILIPPNTVLPASQEETFLPVAWLDGGRERVRLPKIHVVQGESSNNRNNTRIGVIVLPEIYAHGRNLEQIQVRIAFRLEVADLHVAIHIPRATQYGDDIRVEERIHLEERS